MRRIVFAPSFDQEAEDIGVYIEERFGERTRQEFVAELSKTCERISGLPRMGKRNHGYETASVRFVFDQNWIFFDYDDDAVHFLHIVATKRDRPQRPL
jgi:plasmid stabilization system protein ParE